MVRIALCWARATNQPAKAEREGCAAGLVPGTEDVAFDVDVDLSTCDFAALAEAAGKEGALPQLKSLGLSSNQIGDAGASSLAGCLKPCS